jgi:hypothetical protein
MVLPAAPASQPTQLSLTQVLGQYRNLSDEQTIARIMKMLQHKNSDKDPLSQSTLFEYENNLNLLAHRVSAEHTGKHRNSFPTMAEILLRPNGPTWVAQQVPEASERRKLATVFSSVVYRAFGNLSTEAREEAQKAWRLCMSDARKQYMQQKNAVGYGGHMSKSDLISSDTIAAGIDALLEGSADRLLLRLLTCLHYPASYQVQSPLLNLGNVMVVLPQHAHQAPSYESWLAAACKQDHNPAGCVILSKDGKSDMLYILWGLKSAGGGTYKPVATKQLMSAKLSRELRAHLQTRPAGIKFLFTDLRHTVDATQSKPYNGATGRASFNSRINKLLVSVFGAACTQRTFRLSIAHHRAHLHKSSLSTASVEDSP